MHERKNLREKEARIMPLALILFRGYPLFVFNPSEIKSGFILHFPSQYYYSLVAT